MTKKKKYSPGDPLGQEAGTKPEWGTMWPKNIGSIPAKGYPDQRIRDVFGNIIGQDKE